MYNKRTYIAIDLKSFYASVECVERGLDPLTTNLVVADTSRTDKTICLAVSPSLKAYGIPGRARLFEVIQKLRTVNAIRKYSTPSNWLSGKSIYAKELNEHPDWEVDYIAAPPRMSKYMEYSARIYDIYLKYISAEDIHVYSIDEVFIDATNYLKTYQKDVHELTIEIIHDVLRNTGITATAGIGTNLFLCKVAMDIVAKHIPADKDGVRIAELDEQSFREKLWDHRPLTDFWRVGKGIAQRLETLGIYTMGQIARCSVKNEEILYKTFGVNAELLIDHAWGWEPCTISAIKSYCPSSRSISNGQVLTKPYTAAQARTVTQEMADSIVLDLIEKQLVTNNISISIDYDAECLSDPDIAAKYHGDISVNYYGKHVPRRAHGSLQLENLTSSLREITNATTAIYDHIVNPNLLIRRLSIACGNLSNETNTEQGKQPVQLDIFTDYEAIRKEKEQQKEFLSKERKMQEAILEIKKRFGKNSILRGLNFMDGATAKERNNQIGGHKA